jgi:hypothetical protein
MQAPRKTDTSNKGPHSSDDLTCSEGQIEDLFSEGESTEAEGIEKNRSQKKPNKPSPP